MNEIWEHHDVRTNGIRLHVVQAGPEDGPMVILLHGFPEFWASWERQIEALAQAGYRVWVPDQRGYNLSDKPKGIGAYALDQLGADVLGLIDAAGREKAAVVGHDWGANVAWWLALSAPHRLERMAALNVPHPAAFLPHIRRHPSQLLRSWYILFFQLPFVPEWVSRLGNWWLPTQAMKRSSHPGTFSEEYLNRCRQAWAQPGAYRAMLNWYRALLQKRPPFPPDPRVTIPTLLLWGAQDQFLGRELAPRSINYCEQGELILFEDTTHWIQHEQPDRVNFLLDTFLSKGASNA